MTQATVAETTLDVRGTPLVTREAGGGSALLYLHDELSTAWNPFLDALSAKYRVVAPELPGFGDTERPDWAELLTRPPLRSRKVTSERWTHQPGWPTLIRRLAAHLDNRGRPVAIAAFRISD